MNKEEKKAARRKKFLSTLVYERFEIGAILSVVGGFLDAYTFIARDGVFANAQTGNIILLTIGLCEGRFYAALKYLVPIVLFAAGVVISEFIISRERKNGAKLMNYVLLLSIEAAVLVAAAFIPVTKEGNMIANALISFVASVQYATFRKIENLPVATSFCTGNLRSAAHYLYLGIAERDKIKLAEGWKFTAMIAFFGGGVAAGYFVTHALGNLAVLCCAALLPFVCVYLAALKANKMKKLREIAENAANAP